LKEELIRRTARAIHRSNKVVGFTGAGISVESGIPDFRGAGGLWEKYDPAEYATIEAFQADPKKVWAMLKEMGSLLERSKPNPAHLALARLEEMGHVRSVITQNIDNLHQSAGSRRVIEYHGSHQKLICLTCGRVYDREEVRLETLPPLCRCAGVLKPNVVFFGEAIPWSAHLEAQEEAKDCEVMLVIGTSAVVSPACEIPVMAKRAGATIVEVNLEATQLTRHVSDWILKGSAALILQRVLDEVRSLSEG
jgi:NAD-dependent deacetylase